MVRCTGPCAGSLSRVSRNPRSRRLPGHGGCQVKRPSRRRVGDTSGILPGMAPEICEGSGRGRTARFGGERVSRNEELGDIGAWQFAQGWHR